MPKERPSGLVQRSFLLGPEEVEWLNAAAAKTKLTQADLVRLAVLKMRKELGRADRLKREAVEESAAASSIKWAPVKRGGPRRGAAAPK
jgi:hypothetical protein